jgi:hypothetical protein
MLQAGSFRTRLLVLVLLLIVPTILLALVGNFRHQRLEKDRARERATTIAKLAAGRQDFLRPGNATTSGDNDAVSHFGATAGQEGERSRTEKFKTVVAGL